MSKEEEYQIILYFSKTEMFTADSARRETYVAHKFTQYADYFENEIYLLLFSADMAKIFLLQCNILSEYKFT